MKARISFFLSWIPCGSASYDTADGGKEQLDRYYKELTAGETVRVRAHIAEGAENVHFRASV